MAATQSLHRILTKSQAKLLVRRGGTLDSATRPMNVTTSVAKLKRLRIDGRQRKLLTARQNWTVG